MQVSPSKCFDIEKFTVAWIKNTFKTASQRWTHSAALNYTDCIHGNFTHDGKTTLGQKGLCIQDYISTLEVNTVQKRVERGSHSASGQWAYEQEIPQTTDVKPEHIYRNKAKVVTFSFPLVSGSKVVACDAESGKLHDLLLSGLLTLYFFSSFLIPTADLHVTHLTTLSMPNLSSSARAAFIVLHAAPLLTLDPPCLCGQHVKGKLNRRQGVECEIKVIACAGGRINS